MKHVCLILLSACAAQPRASERPQATGPEYDIALSHVLASAKASDAKSLRAAFDLGYVTGQVEAYAVALKLRGERMEQGCRTAVKQLEAVEARWCTSLKDSKVADAAMHGAAYAKGRLGVAERALAHGEPQAETAAYDGGYTASFTPLVSQVDKPEAAAEQRVLGCLAAVAQATDSTSEGIRICCDTRQTSCPSTP